jgi:hypothetical protein
MVARFMEHKVKGTMPTVDVQKVKESGHFVAFLDIFGISKFKLLLYTLLRNPLTLCYFEQASRSTVFYSIIERHPFVV